MNEELVFQRSIADVTLDIRRKTGEFLLTAIEIGRLLFEAKAMVEPGGWGKYIEEELPFSQSWANNYMKLYKEFGSDQTSLFGNSQTFLKLRPTQALELLQLPMEDREAFVESHDVENMSTRQLRSVVQAQLEETQAKLRDAEQNVLNMQQQLSAAKSSEGAWQEQIDKLTSERDTAEINEEKLQKEIDKLTAEKHLAETGEKNAMNKVEVLENQLKDAKKAVKQAKSDLKHAKEHPEVPENLMEELRTQAETEAAEKAEADLQKKLAEAAAALDKEAAKRQEVERQLAEAQKRQKMADPNLMAVQALGTQMIALANSINGHRLKAIMQNQDMAKPINGYLVTVINELRQSFGIKITDLEAVK